MSMSGVRMNGFNGCSRRYGRVSGYLISVHPDLVVDVARQCGAAQIRRRFVEDNGRPVAALFD